MASAYTLGGVAFDYDPVPIPDIVPDRLVEVIQTSPSSLVPSASIVIDAGADLSRARIQIHLVSVTSANKALLKALYDVQGNVAFYHAKDAITYTCAWAPGRSCYFYRDAGIDSDWACDIELIPLSQA